MKNLSLSKSTIVLLLIAVVSMTLIAVLSGTFVRAEVQLEKFLYIENGNAYISSVASAPAKVSENVEGILDYNAAAGKYLYRVADPENGYMHGGGTLVLANSTGNTKVITENIMTAALSPDGTRIVVWNEDNEIHLMTVEGNNITQIGVHGALPVFSHDGTYVAYNKLADQGDRFFDLHKNSPYGIALYNLKTGEEKVVTDNIHDFQPLGFSADMSNLYFNSGREYDTSPEGFSNHVASLWVVDLETEVVTRLTNMDEKAVRGGAKFPIVHATALWSSDRKTLISSLGAESGVWKFTFNSEGGLISANRLANGTSPRWIVPEKRIAVRTNIDGESEWRAINIK